MDRSPSKVLPKFAGINRVTLVVPWTVGDEANECAPRAGSEGAGEFIDEVTEFLDNLEIAPLSRATNVVGRTGHCLGENSDQRCGVILNVQPITDVIAGTIYGQRFSS